MTPVERFERLYYVEPNSGCWLWLGSVVASRNGALYGHFLMNKKMQRAHRVSFELAGGTIPEGAHVLHSCDVSLCVNPAHLFLGNNLINARDRQAKGRGVQLFGSRHGNAKLVEADVVQIRTLLARGYGRTELARFYGVGQSTIGRIKFRQGWRHVDG